MSPQRHIHLDAIGGVTGDMFVAAMLDALPALRARVFADLAAFLSEPVPPPSLVPGASEGIALLRFGPTAGPAGSAARRDVPYESWPRESRDGLTTLAQRIDAAVLADGTTGHAMAILTILVEAEGRVRGLPTGAVPVRDVIDDNDLTTIVAAASIIAALPETTWDVSGLPRGAGLSRTPWGLRPVPAPATLEMLKGFVWRDDGIAGERVTPAGAAILAHLIRTRGGTMGPMRLTAAGTGGGALVLTALPNILRALVFSADETGDAATGDAVYVLSFDVDDMTGEEIGIALQRLRAVPGMIDATVGSRIGKKGRPVNDFRLLVRTGALDAAQALCFQETTTIGLRYRLEQRRCLERDLGQRPVAGQFFPIKTVRRPGNRMTRKVESDALAPIPGLAERRRLQRLAEEDEDQP